MIGKNLAHYHILKEVGAGGMGVVYEAEDTRLKRRVALKVLPAELAEDPQRMERFQREAEALASLNHPNIVTVYSVEEADGVPFLTMELVSGQALDQTIPAGGMDLEAFFTAALPLVDALCSAHEVNITHRDLKPANIMIGADGRLKVLDFGLAKLQEEKAADHKDDKTRVMDEELTGEGLIVGTVPYMSPEQLEGKPVDARTDIFSLGIILYEMATGARPFQGDSSAAVMSSILKDSPQSVTSIRTKLPRHLGRVIGSCLEKDPENRPQTAKGLRNTLRGLQKELETESLLQSDSGVMARPSQKKNRRVPVIAGTFILLIAAAVVFMQLRDRYPDNTDVEQSTDTVKTSDSQRQMIVVLPFENLGAAEDEYFADGLTEEITSRLAAVKGLGVISRTSAMQYKSERPPVRQIGQELGVDFILEGSVRWEQRAEGPSRIRVTPQLIRVADDTHLWSSRYDGQLNEIFRVQSDIAEAVTRELNITLLDPEREALAAIPTNNMEAYQAYLRGMETWNRPGYDPQRFRLAGQLFERAVELDPDFLLAWTELTSVYDMLYQGGDESEEILQKAAEALRHAERLQPDHPKVHLAKGYHYYLGYLDYERALVEFEAAATALPNDPSVHEGIGYIRRRQGRIQEGITKLEEAARLDPQNSHIHLMLAGTYQAVRDYAAADRHFDRSIALAPDGVDAYLEKANNLISWRGSTAEARAVVNRAPRGNSTPIVLTHTWLDIMEKDFTAAAVHLATLTPTNMESSWEPMMYYLFLGQCQLYQGQTDRARQTFTTGREQALGNVAAGLREAQSQGFVASFEAYLGNATADRLAIERSLTDAAGDLFYGIQTRETLARMHVVLGEEDEAVSVLAEMLATPYFMRLSPNDLQLDPFWDPLRENPRFQQLLTTSNAPDS